MIFEQKCCLYLAWDDAKVFCHSTHVCQLFDLTIRCHAMLKVQILVLSSHPVHFLDWLVVIMATSVCTPERATPRLVCFWFSSRSESVVSWLNLLSFSWTYPLENDFADSWLNNFEVASAADWVTSFASEDPDFSATVFSSFLTSATWLCLSIWWWWLRIGMISYL